ncbi:MAG: hypothetical protein ABII71_03240 [Candidatus Micrarchaeota archaeon]
MQDNLTLYQKMKLKRQKEAEPESFENTYSLQSMAGRLALLSLLFLFLSITVPEMRMFGTASLAGLFLFLVCYGFFQIKNSS